MLPRIELEQVCPVIIESSYSIRVSLIFCLYQDQCRSEQTGGGVVLVLSIVGSGREAAEARATPPSFFCVSLGLSHEIKYIK